MEQMTKNVSPMSNEARNTYVIEHITSALIELMKHKPINNISISEICNEAGVGRTSFYRNYETKEDILVMHINKLFLKLKYDYEAIGGDSVKGLILLIFSAFEEDRAFYSLLNEQKLIYLLKDAIINEMSGLNPEEEKIVAYTKAFAAYTIYGLIEVWFQRGMQETAQEMAEFFPS